MAEEFVVANPPDLPGNLTPAVAEPVKPAEKPLDPETLKHVVKLTIALILLPVLLFKCS